MGKEKGGLEITFFVEVVIDCLPMVLGLEPRPNGVSFVIIAEQQQQRQDLGSLHVGTHASSSSSLAAEAAALSFILLPNCGTACPYIHVPVHTHARTYTGMEKGREGIGLCN